MRSFMLVVASAALTLAAVHLIYQYVRLGESYTRLMLF
jgi:hypothetical protein